MSIMKKLKQVILNACFYFTASEFLILITANAFNQLAPSNGGAVGKFLSLGAAALVFLACIAVSALNLVLRSDYSLSVRLVIHFLGCLAVWTLVTVIIPGAYTNMMQIIVRLLLFAVIYLIIAFAVLIVKSIVRNRRSEEKEYESSFGNSYRK